MTDLLLNGMATYGALTLGIALLLGALGTPVPTSLMVIAAGALARQGLIDWLSAFGAGLVGAVVGDSLGYMLGRSTNSWVQRRCGRSSAWQAAQDRFQRCGGWMIYLSRFLLIPLAIPANVIAGGSGYGWRRFLTCDIAGELTWLALYGGLGYAFGSQWELISNFISDFSGLLVGLVILGVGIYLLFRLFRRPATETAVVSARVQ